ncbi:asparaginase, partial [Acinetobacter baumannii]
PHVCGIDGCSVPTWALPLNRLAGVFACLASGDGVPPARQAAVSRVLKACWAEPELVAGHGCAETVVLAAMPDRIYLKSG